MPTARGVRERARAEITSEIVRAGRHQLATDGAAALSLRAVARELGMVSSAVYRYVASRDELLTLLIIEAYDALGAEVEQAAAPTAGRSPAARFMAVGRAVRSWAVANPHQYALLYGSPVPGYEAPQDTIGPASRVTLALVGIVADAHRDGLLETPTGVPAELPAALRRDLAAVREAASTELPDDVIVAMIAAWTQLFGLVSFELFGQTRNVIVEHAALFDATLATMAATIGLPSLPAEPVERR
jgi:AcrR family transcriptional regulator